MKTDIFHDDLRILTIEASAHYSSL